MSDNNKYTAPSGPPPNYPQQAYTGPGNPGPGSPEPYGDQNLNQVAAYNTGYVQPQGQGYGPPGGYYQQGFQEDPMSRAIHQEGLDTVHHKEECTINSSRWATNNVVAMVLLLERVYVRAFWDFVLAVAAWISCFRLLVKSCGSAVWIRGFPGTAKFDRRCFDLMR